MKEGVIESFWSAWEELILHIVNNLFNWHRWRIRIDGICAMEELYSHSINEAMLVGSWAYDTLDALKRASLGHFGRLGYHHSCMLLRIY